MHTTRPLRGFTLIELMIVIAIISMLATLATPSLQDRVMRAQIGEGLALADLAKQAVQSHYAKTRKLPANNEAAGLPPADRIVGNYVSSIAVQNGVVTLTFGQQSNRHLVGKKLSLRPATVPDYPQVPIAWVCGTASVPETMTAPGDNATDLPGTQLPLECRGMGNAVAAPGG